jgi:putative Holliday junction resolvase
VSEELPKIGRLAGIDYGEARIGVSITDPERRIASPLANYTRRTPAADAAWFVQLAKEERIAGFVVGLPVYPSGDESPQSGLARRFGAWLHETTGLPVRFFDERYTTALADQFLGQARLTRKERKARRDKLAAQILLAAFLESTSRETPGPLDK